MFFGNCAVCVKVLLKDQKLHFPYKCSMKNEDGELLAVLSEIGGERCLCLEVRKWEKMVYKRFSQ